MYPQTHTLPNAPQFFLSKFATTPPPKDPKENPIGDPKPQPPAPKPSDPIEPIPEELPTPDRSNPDHADPDHVIQPEILDRNSPSIQQQPHDETPTNNSPDVPPSSGIDAP